MFPPSLQWVPWPPRAGPCGSPPSRVLWGRTTAPPSIHGHLWSPLVAGTSAEEMGSSLGFLENPFGSMPRARDSGGPVRPHPTGRPGTAFRSHNSVGVRHDSISELNLRGLLPCCVRFAPTSHPVNGNTHYRPACSLWPCGTCTRWIPSRGFTVSSSVSPLPSFSQRDNNVGPVKSFVSTLRRSLREWSSLFFFDLCFDDHGSLVIFRSASVRPKHLFDPYFDHDY